MQIIGSYCGASESFRARVFEIRYTNKTKIAKDKTIIDGERSRIIVYKTRNEIRNRNESL